MPPYGPAGNGEHWRSPTQAVPAPRAYFRESFVQH